MIKISTLFRQTREDLKTLPAHSFVTEEQIELFGMEAAHNVLYVDTDPTGGGQAQLFVLNALVLRLISGSDVRQWCRFQSPFILFDIIYRPEICYTDCHCFSIDAQLNRFPLMLN